MSDQPWPTIVNLSSGKTNPDAAGPKTLYNGHTSFKTHLLRAAGRSQKNRGCMSQPLSVFDENEQSIRILLVEDHESTAHVLSRLLVKAGYQVAVAGDLASSRNVMQHDHFDLLLSDLGLPDGSGLDLMHEVASKQGIPGIAFSGYGTDQDVQKSLAAGFCEHLVKPIDMERLLRAVKHAVGEKSPQTRRGS
jgi:CheY-like chemotaxis protein